MEVTRASFGTWGENVLFSGDICYTEDQIIVYNLYLANIPRSLREDTIKEYFSHFGEVSSVSVVEKKMRRNNKFRYGFVNFKQAKSAALALKASHSNLHKHIIVKAADSWKQPLMEISKESKSNSDNEMAANEEDSASILSLNDDCLLHIFSFLTLSEQLKMSGLCQRFWDVFEIIFRIGKSLNLQSTGTLTLFQVKQIVSQVGHHIQRVHILGDLVPNSYSRCIEFVVHSCPNVYWLELSSISNIRNETFKKMSQNLRNITKLELKRCCITDQICLQLSQLPKVQILDLSENYELTGRHLHKFKELIHLDLSYCSNIQSKHFVDICKGPKLKYLNIRRCDRLNKQAFTEMTKNLTELECLIISCSYQTDQISQIAELKSLQSLSIHCTENVRDEFFEKLKAHKSETLRSLEIIGGFLDVPKQNIICAFKNLEKLAVQRDTQITNEFLRNIATFPALKTLNVSGCSQITKMGILSLLQSSDSIEIIDISCCYQFYQDFVLDAIDMLKAKGRDSPCTLIVGNTHIEDNITLHPKYLENKSILTLSFKICEYGFEFGLGEDGDSMSDDDIFEDMYYYSHSDDDDDDDLFAIDDFEGIGYDDHFMCGAALPWFLM